MVLPLMKGQTLIGVTNCHIAIAYTMATSIPYGTSMKKIAKLAAGSLENLGPVEYTDQAVPMITESGLTPLQWIEKIRGLLYDVATGEADSAKESWKALRKVGLSFRQDVVQEIARVRIGKSQVGRIETLLRQNREG